MPAYSKAHPMVLLNTSGYPTTMFIMTRHKIALGVSTIFFLPPLLFFMIILFLSIAQETLKT